MTSNTDHAADIRARIGKLAALGARAESSNAAIRAAAEKRKAAVQSDIESLRPHARLDGAAADQYQDRVRERGLLERLLAS